MIKVLKKLSAPAVMTALGFLLIQIFSNLYLPYLTASIVNKGILQGDLGAIQSLGVLMMGLTLISLVAALLNTFVASKISFKVGQELRSELYQKVLTFSKKEYDEIGAASLITRNITDVSQVQNLVSMLLKFLVLAPFYLIGGIVLTYLLSPKLSLVFIAVLPVLFIAAFAVQKFASPLYGKMQVGIDRLNLIFREGLSGVKVIRAFNQGNNETEKYRQVNIEYQTNAIKAGTIMSAFLPLISFIMNVTTLVVIWIGGHDVATGNMEIGTIIAVMNYASQILMGFGILTSVILEVPKGQISARRIFEVLEKPLSVKNPEQPETMEFMNKNLVFEDVHFSYPKANKAVLKEINLQIKPGQTLAIIGGTGDGKSSLLQLINRMYDVTDGQIKLGSTDIRNMTQEELNRLISYTPQQSVLFSGTIRSNLQMAKSDATDQEMWQVLDWSNASEFVKKSGLGLEMPIEKSGGNFSGGQKQRLSIARTLLKDAAVYLFDDSFSALDFKTDQGIRRQLDDVLQEKIRIIVAQRINTIIDADMILVMNQGQVSGIGTHQELLATNEIYQEIIQSQTNQEEVA